MTPGIAGLLQVAVPFIWLGAVLAISFLEAPLKFRAPGITVPLGLGIGRLVFRALNISEIAFAVALTAAVLTDGSRVPTTAIVGVLIALWAVLVMQVGALRPRLDQRTRRIMMGETVPRSHHHLAYIALEGLKVPLLVVLGVLLVARLTT
ncbi:hypothetical protein [Pseudonocardia acidicola]|uniref:DUF4149 domain-containing protein n=1 Tax=Pseudonocardia acidicola TaxID=2724939 RepID=A0ABX1SD77_9PSEU|nr:hypothetical protein [Pseudonocardia acidicola]NMH99518.1 hypothetical protein [Pseudonocardia acidicola]